MSLRNRLGGLVMGLSLCGVQAPAYAQNLSGSLRSAQPPHDEGPRDEASSDSTERSAKNSVYMELGGNAIVYSVNYDRYILDNVIGRIGFSYWSLKASASDGSSARVDVYSAPVMASFVTGSRNHKLELGAGALLVYVSAEAKGSTFDVYGEGTTALATGVVGYRYSPADGGFTFRAGYTPLAGSEGVAHWGGVSFGGAF